MHDPEVVAFTLLRPWPQRQSRPFGKSRWRFHGHFWNIAGIGLYWPSLITVWHVEPGGRDSGEVCKHHRRWRDENDEWQSVPIRSWRWHVHHWRIQVHPLQHLRRWALTRCEWCHGRSRKGDVANFSHQWDPDKGRWWRGERGLYHKDCSDIATAHRVCLCGVGPWEHGTGGQPYGLCASCGKYRGWRKEPRPPPDPRIPVPQNPPKPSKLARFEAWALRVMFATPIPAVWEPKR
jgi:hypothetical protein